jgi:hypothetical protein
VYKTVTVTVAKAQEGPPVASAGRRVERCLANRIEQADARRIVDAVPLYRRLAPADHGGAGRVTSLPHACDPGRSSL